MAETVNCFRKLQSLILQMKSSKPFIQYLLRTKEAKKIHCNEKETL